MDTYYIELPHTPEECKAAIKEIYALGYITHFEWGCKAGHHIGFFRMETDDEKEPMRILPPYIRQHAKIFKVSKFSPDDVKMMH